ncbi:hypothetical protein HMPREF1531_00724 [Propionibacterium sp. oral taxon 192 str. F0372]|uniref:glycerol dehydratase reactivase beta/small subunit family protein n=1 Tax=Propionibacterium sp. oral taxon 192 TaxID=671222 RepID=UPI000352C98D|nr:glycerol dehydratase reactivase beta/small subunit family protein [Propionibacterium sp. oral taxon 192]EPH06076.1 hypothetical protein HMPREF1531_00724 [Propionibacterium sp. oral taxon 192 str. F0372]
MPQATQERPVIRLHVNEHVDLPRLRDLVLGIEEEAVPVFVEVTSDGDAAHLAHQASVQATLEIGIGVDTQDIAVTTSKLPDGAPYLITGLNLSAANDRNIGANAARLVKRNPLLPIERSPHAGAGNH